MIDQPPAWLFLIAFLGALGPLVFFHELGHYLVARWCGVGAETFSIGFGREILGWTDKRGTRWKIGWLPLGGYVKFVGDMNPASAPASLDDIPPELRSSSFHAKPVWQRFLIVLAGPMANFLLAILIFAAFFATTGAPRTPNVVGGVVTGMAADKAGILPGDRLLSVAGRSTDTFEEVAQLVMLRPGQTLEFEVERQGSRLSVPVPIPTVVEKDRFGQEYRVGRLGITRSNSVYTRLPPLELLPAATTYTVQLTRAMMEGLWQIITGRRSVRELGGPLKIAQVAGQQASLGLFPFVALIALMSINLGFINLLPVPMLDGGHLLFYGVEAVRRRPVSERTMEWAFRGGLAAILMLLLFTTANDLGSFGLWERLERLIG